MRAASKKRNVLIVAAIAIFTEGVMFSVLSHQHASHSPSLLLIFHLPGILLVDLMHISDPKAQVVIAVTGAVQLFALFLVGLIVWRLFYGRHDN